MRLRVRWITESLYGSINLVRPILRAAPALFYLREGMYWQEEILAFSHPKKF